MNPRDQRQRAARGPRTTVRGGSSAAATTVAAAAAARVRQRTGTTVGAGRDTGRVMRCSRSVVRASEQRLERVPKVFQVVSVQQRVAGRIEMRQDDARVQ